MLNRGISLIRKMSSSIKTIDCKYAGKDNLMTSYLLVQNDIAAFVDNNTNHALPELLQSLKDASIDTNQVKYICVTHIHLDHAGCTGSLAKACPNATILCHPNAAPHLIDPSKIIKGAKAVYGEDEFNKLYGTLLPVDSKRVIAVEDGQKFFLSNDNNNTSNNKEQEERPLQFWFTRGHANHHVVIHDIEQKSIFTGDSFGVSYKPLLQPLQSKQSTDFLFPSTTPIDFDADEAKKSIDLILNSGASIAYLAHVGEWKDIPQGAKQLHKHLDYFKSLLDIIENKIVKENKTGEQVTKEIEEILWNNFFIPELESRDVKITETIREWFRLDLQLNASGLVVNVQRKLRRLAKAAAAVKDAKL